MEAMRSRSTRTRQQTYQANTYRIRQLLVEEGLGWHVGRNTRSDQEQWRPLDLDTQVKYRKCQILVEEGLERYVRRRACTDQEQRRPMGLDTQVQHPKQLCCSALVSSRWSFLAPEGCDILTGITRRRQVDSFEPGLGISVGGIKPGPSGLSGLSGSSGLSGFWLNETNQINQTNQITVVV